MTKTEALEFARRYCVKPERDSSFNILRDQETRFQLISELLLLGYYPSDKTGKDRSGYTSLIVNKGDNGVVWERADIWHLDTIALTEQ